MNKILKGNLLTDIIWLGFGLAGGIYFYLEGRFWESGLFFFVALLYLIKIINNRMGNRSGFKLPD
ncbi:hypothetical protein ACT6NV_03300 [Robiginitalea sp. IMCC44478]|uniref:hypothetical protein n=1 Tax=Robiginitalea sp. IMCC44478 TaxID=3459122 RepID=UPI00404332F2